jgi:ankyrin repeat protein
MSPDKARFRPDALDRFIRSLWQGDHDNLAALVGQIDPNGANRWNQRPLPMAVQFGSLAIVRELVRRGATVDQGCQHLTPITLAARRGASDVVDFLRQAGARESIVTAVYLGDRAQVARELARDPALARLCDEAGSPLVHHAACALQPELVQLLIANGASVTETAGDRGQTALHVAADLRRAPQEPVRRMVTLLLDHGADPNARNWDSVTPLHQAVRARNLAAVELLLARGADPNARDGRESTPLRRAVSGTGASSTAGTAFLMVPLTQLLLAHGADPDAVDKRGVPVHASARDPDVRALLEAHRRPQTRARKPRPAKSKAPTTKRKRSSGATRPLGPSRTTGQQRTPRPNRTKGGKRATGGDQKKRG